MKRHLILCALAATLGDSLQAQRPPTPAPTPLRAPATPARPRIEAGSQLLITDLRVVEDPVRTQPRSGPRAAWTFRHLVENMAGNQDPSEFVLTWLRQWETDQAVNGHIAPARPSIRELVIDPWLKASGGRRLDLGKAPFKLLAIVNRMDLHVRDGSKVATGGEGRFVFGVLGADGTPLPSLAGTGEGAFTVIFEYELPAKDLRQLRDWAFEWAALGANPVGSPPYNQALESLTRRFTNRGAAPWKPNGSALNQIRSNELALGLPWELREFVLDPSTRRLRPSPVALSPDVLSLNGTPEFAALVNDNESALLAETFVLPPELEAASSLAGPFQVSDFPDAAERTFATREFFDPFVDVPWSADGIRNNDARHALALNTCGGCHRTETGATFLQIGFPKDHQLPRSLGKKATLAGFLTGIQTPDPVVPGTLRSFNDLERRRAELEALLASFGPNGIGPGPRGRHVPHFVH
jgi:hypothetical protein